MSKNKPRPASPEQMLTQAVTRIKTLEGWLIGLRPWVQHNMLCGVWLKKPCTCGLIEFAAKIKV